MGSLRYASRVLAKLLGFLDVREGALLEGYCSGNMLPNDDDPFPDFVLTTDWLEPGYTRKQQKTSFYSEFLLFIR